MPARLRALGYAASGIRVRRIQAAGSSSSAGVGICSGACQTAFSKFGARYLIRGGRQEVTEGQARSRTVVLEFPSFEVALACYRSDDYQAAKKFRDGNADLDLVIVEGYDGTKF